MNQDQILSYARATMTYLVNEGIIGKASPNGFDLHKLVFGWTGTTSFDSADVAIDQLSPALVSYWTKQGNLRAVS